MREHTRRGVFAEAGAVQNPGVGVIVEVVAYPCFRIEQDRLGLWRWTYYHEEGRPIAMSFAGHPSERDCRRAIELIGHCGQAQIVLKEPTDTGRFLRPDFDIHAEPAHRVEVTHRAEPAQRAEATHRPEVKRDPVQSVLPPWEYDF
jgi:uncharacterized protein YegP (UPF0339 family)